MRKKYCDNRYGYNMYKGATQYKYNNEATEAGSPNWEILHFSWLNMDVT